MRSCTGTPDNDMDHDLWLNGPEQPVEPEDYCRHSMRGATCGKCHEYEFDCTPITFDRCDHGEIVSECWRCRMDDEAMGAALAARFEGGE